MVNSQYLEEVIAASGLKKSFIAAELGISIQTLRKKISGISDFTMREANKLCDLLGVKSLAEKEKIFNKK